MENTNNSIRLELNASDVSKLYSKKKIGSLILSVVIAIIAICLSIYINFFLYPVNAVMKVGKIVVTKDDYAAITAHLTASAQAEGVSLTNSMFESYVSERILLGLKAKELGYTIEDDYYSGNYSVYGDLAEYFYLADRLEQYTVSNAIAPTYQEISKYYEENLDNFIDYEKSTFTFTINNEKVTMDEKEFNKNYVITKISEDSFTVEKDGNSYEINDIEYNYAYEKIADVKKEISDYLQYINGTGKVINYAAEMASEYPVRMY